MNEGIASGSPPGAVTSPLLAATDRINIIGFSLTGFGDGTSFGKLLESRLNSMGWTGQVREISYGGLSINALAGLIGLAASPIRPGEVVGLELATSFFSLHRYKLKDARPLVFAIVRHFVERASHPLFFLNLFRADLNDEDCVVLAIREAAEYFNIGILDLKPEFRRLSVDGPFGTTDGIHPDPVARDRIAAELQRFVLSAELRVPTQRHHEGPSYRFLDCCEGSPAFPLHHYEARGKAIRALVLRAGEDLTIDLGQSLRVEGVCFLYGPETGYITLTVDAQEPMELITFDEHSYYRRIGFRPVNQIGRRVTVRSLEKTRPVALVRPTNLKTDGRCDFICGLVVSP